MTLTKQDDILNLVGVIGGSAISLSLLPQVLLTYRTKCTTDISYLYQAIYIFGTALVNTYAIYFGYWAVYVPCLLEMFLIITLTVMKVIYDQRNKKLSQQSRRRSSLVQSFKSDAMKGANARTCHLNLESVHRKTYDLSATSLESNLAFPISAGAGNCHSLDPLSYLKKSLHHFHKVEIDTKEVETMESISNLAKDIETFLKNIAVEKDDKRNDEEEECDEEKQ